MNIKNNTWIISTGAWICLIVYIIVKYRLYKQLNMGPLKRLTGEVIIVQVWIMMIFLLMISEKIDFIIARY